MIPYGRQNITEEDIQAVVETLRSDFLTQGPAVPQFEKAVCDYTGGDYACAVNSATAALHLACLALGLEAGDRLWTSPITFVASANCGLYCGAEVDFVDIDPQTFNLCADALEEKLKQAEKEGKLPKIVVPVHLCGLPCDMEKIAKLARQYGFHVIEDAAHAIGGRYQESPVGRCEYSDITVFSFHPVKIVTTGEGGMAVTNNKKLADKMALLRSHGITRDQDQMTHEADGSWYYQQIDLGFNYRMTDLQAALGTSQMTRLDKFVQRRHQIKARYDKHFSDLTVTPQQHPSDCYSGLHLYVIRLKTDQINKSHQTVFETMRTSGIGVNLHYIPVHTQPYFNNMGFKKGDYPEAEKYYAEAISLPMFYDLTDTQIDQVVQTLDRSLK